MSNIEEYTKNFKFMIPEFNVATWHTEIKENFKAIDALIANFVQSQQYKGAWKQVTQYEIGDLVYISDENSNNYGGLFKVLVDHITTADDFDTFLGDNPTYYDLQGEMGAQVAALRAQDWAEKTDGIVVINESPVDYSSKAYAIGGTGTETNNSKYFKEQAELARDGILLDPGFIAIKNDLLGDENIKTVADNILNVNSIGDNILSILSVYNNLSDINTCSSNINAILDAPTQATNAYNSVVSAANSAQLAQEAALSVTNGWDLFDHKWEDHLLNDQNWLRADTFSWHPAITQYGTYLEAYNHLVDDYTNGTTQTETIGSYTITYVLATDGHKITTDETTVENIYNESGVAWYYVLDTTNQRFKLPRTKYGFVGLRDTVGKYVSESLPNIVAGNFLHSDTADGTISGACEYTRTTTSDEARFPSTNRSYDTQGVKIDASISSSAYQNNAPVQQRATQMYLYFYIGQFSQTATEQTAGLNTELFNNKVDLNAANLSTQGKSLIAGLGMPSDYYEVITIPATTNYYEAPANGYLSVDLQVSNGGYVQLALKDSSSNTGFLTDGTGITNQTYCKGHIPMKKGQKCYFYYSGLTGNGAATFVYLEGDINA